MRRQFPRETDCLLSQGAATGTVVSKVVGSGGEELSNLEYPKAMSAGEREEAGKKLTGIPVDLAQQLLDELAASIGANVIQTTPLAYLRGLVTRAREGTYTPEGALRVAAQRKHRAEVEIAIRHNEDRGSDYLPAAVDTENPLMKKLFGIQKRSQEKGREPD